MAITRGGVCPTHGFYDGMCEECIIEEQDKRTNYMMDTIVSAIEDYVLKHNCRPTCIYLGKDDLKRIHKWNARLQDNYEDNKNNAKLFGLEVFEVKLSHHLRIA